MKRTFIYLSAILFFLLDLFPASKVFAAVKTSDLETTPWSAVAESSFIVDSGWLQGMCATDQYIVCLINASKNGTDPDTLIAFYRNDTDAAGNPVQKYGYAFHVTETDYEHGNGMTYNPNTQEIAIAGLFTNDPSNAGAVFLVDANTLHFKRKVQVGNGSMNYFGIDYVPEKNQYVLMANRIADYSFVFTDADFQISELLNLHLSYSRSSFQDFVVSGDSIISIPYMQREGYMNILDVYSISQQQRVGSYYLSLPGHDSFDVEPEGICQLEPGHFLMASVVHGTKTFKLYEAYLPIVYSVITSAENGTISEPALEVPEGESQTVSYSCEEGYRLKSLTVDGEEQNITDYPSEYTFTDVRSDHTVSAVFEEIPRYTVTTSSEHGTIDENPTGLEHEPLTIHFQPEEHYELDQFLIDGVPVELEKGAASYTFEDLTADHTLSVTYKAIPAFTIQVSAKNATVAETTATVYRDDSYSIHVTPDKYCSLMRCLVDGKRTSLKQKGDSLVLENVQGSHEIQLVYGRLWLRLLIPGLLIPLFLLILQAVLLHRRRKRRRKRHQELLKMRKENREFFSALDEMAAMYPDTSDNRDDDAD